VQENWMNRLTKTAIFFFLMGAVGLISPLRSAFSEQTSSAKPPRSIEQIVKKIDRLWRGASSQGIVSITVKTAHYTRSMRVEVWSKGTEQSLIRIDRPLKEKGTTTLKSGNHIYTYLPKTDRTIRLTSGMMMDAWMGSHFTNDDLVRESHLLDDYSFALTSQGSHPFESEKEGIPVYEITLTPKPEAPVVWSQVVLTVRAEDEMPLWQVYYGDGLQPIRKLIFSDVKELGGRRFPTRLKMTVMEKPEEFTELIYEAMAFDIDLDDRFFSLSRLRAP
jgi:hypothetical protein